MHYSLLQHKTHRKDRSLLPSFHHVNQFQQFEKTWKKGFPPKNEKRWKACDLAQVNFTKRIRERTATNKNKPRTVFCVSAYPCIRPKKSQPKARPYSLQINGMFFCVFPFSLYVGFVLVSNHLGIFCDATFRRSFRPRIPRLKKNEIPSEIFRHPILDERFFSFVQLFLLDKNFYFLSFFFSSQTNFPKRYSILYSRI